MKRTCLLFAAFLLLPFALFPTVASADFVDDALTDYGDIVPEGEAGADDAELLRDAVGIKAIMSDILLAISGQRGDIAVFFMTLFGVTVLTSLSSSQLSGFLSSELASTSESAIAAVGSVLVFEQLQGLVGAVTAAIGELSGFFGALVPIMTAITASGGGAGTAAAQASGMSLTLGAVNMLSARLLLPAVSVIFALALVGSVSSDGAVSALAVSVKNVFMWTLGILSALLVASLSLQTVITSAADSMAMRSAKYAASGMIPIVGGTVSASLSTLASGLAYAKSAVGTSAISVLVGICMAPLVRLLAYRLAFELCLSLSGFFSSPAAKHLSAMRSALDALTAVFSISAVIYIIEIILFMKCGVALL